MLSGMLNRGAGICQASCTVLLILSMTVWAQESRPAITVIDRVTIIDGTGGPVLAGGAIVVEGQTIREIGLRDEVSFGPNATVIDAAGKFAIPGLIDAHVHFDQSAGLFARPDLLDLRHVRPYDDEIEWTRQRLPQTLRRYLWAGVTGVVDMGGPLWTLDDLRKSSRDSDRGLSMLATGPLISTEAVPELESPDPPVIAVESAAEARQWIRRIAEHGPDLVKILFLYHPSDDFDLYAGVVAAAVAESHTLGLRAAVHATSLEAARAAVMAGADILVHSVEDRPVNSEFIAMLRARDVLYIPTLLVTQGYDAVFWHAVTLSPIEERLGDPEVIRSWGQLEQISPVSANSGSPQPSMLESLSTQFHNLRQIHAAGVRVAAGSDAGNIGTLHGPALHKEMELMVEAGLLPMDVLVAATQNGAAVMGYGSEAGTLQEGKIADIVLLDADPSRDIQNTRKIFRVMKAGQWIADIP